MARETEVKVDKLEGKYDALAAKVAALQAEMEQVLSIINGVADEDHPQPVQNGKVRKAHR